MGHQDNEFMRNLLAIFAGLVVFTICIIFVARIITTDDIDAVNGPEYQAKLQDRIQAVGQVEIASTAQGKTETRISNSANTHKGKQVYSQACFACHGTGWQRVRLKWLIKLPGDRVSLRGQSYSKNMRSVVFKPCLQRVESRI